MGLRIKLLLCDQPLSELGVLVEKLCLPRLGQDTGHLIQEAQTTNGQSSVQQDAKSKLPLPESIFVFQIFCQGTQLVVPTW